MTQMSFSSDAIEVDDALQAIELFAERGWTDGLPIIPPTEGLVADFVEALGLSPDAVLGVEPAKGVAITAEKAAINAVMAGCKPEYMPVLAAVIGAITAPEFGLHGISVSTMGAAVMIIVNGPVATDLGMNSGVSVFGPGNRANASIGRAVRLVIINVLGTRAGDLDKATIGHPGKYAWCMAENEELSPWEPVHETRGRPPGSSAVTVAAGLGPFQVGQHHDDTPERILDAFIDPLFAMGPLMEEALIVICPEHLEHFRAAGWTKAQVGGYLHENARRNVSEWTAAGRPLAEDEPEGTELVSALSSPESLVTVVAGGGGGAWSQIVPTWTHGARSMIVTKPVLA
ncbi:MAG: hypothetical protein QF554_13120 [Dehalococcoidia bacterium]|nr:hypothetical protein [Dehalococcoidia bacterium]